MNDTTRAALLVVAIVELVNRLVEVTPSDNDVIRQGRGMILDGAETVLVELRRLTRDT